MGDKIVEGIWDCPYCDATSIGGLQKYCPNCGHPQDKDTKFRLGEKKRYLTDDEISKVGTDPDWACDYCDSLNNSKYKYCHNCGASREKDTKDYFDLHQTSNNKKQKKKDIKIEYDSDESISSLSRKTSHVMQYNIKDEELFNEVKNKNIENNNKSKSKKINSSYIKYILFVLASCFALFGIVFGLIQLFTPREYNGYITEKYWERSIDIEEYKTFQESDWSLPLDARLQYTNREIKSYENVLDHYETKTKQVPYTVQDGYTTSYSDNGNGTFTEHKTPKYKTEYRTETYQEPVYREEPAYATKYYYEIDRWVHGRYVRTSGRSNDKPYWGEVVLQNKEREGHRNETYSIDIKVHKKKDKYKTYTYNSDIEEWKLYDADQYVKITVITGIVTDIEILDEY